MQAIQSARFLVARIFVKFEEFSRHHDAVWTVAADHQFLQLPYLPEIVIFRQHEDQALKKSARIVHGVQ